MLQFVVSKHIRTHLRKHFFIELTSCSKLNGLKLVDCIAPYNIDVYTDDTGDKAADNGNVLTSCGK